MRTIHSLCSLHIIAAAAAASLPTSGEALASLSTLLSRHATGCSHSANWQGGAGSSTARVCDNGYSIAVDNKGPLINKTDCHTVIQELDTKTGQGHWDLEWTCDGSNPDVLQSSAACGFAIESATETNENTITPQDVIEFINQAMDMFPNNDTMQAVTGSTTCDNNNGQIIDWRVGPSSSGSGAGKVQLRWSWLCLVGTLAVGLSFQRSI